MMNTNNTNNTNTQREAGMDYDQIVRDPAKSRPFSITLPDGRFVAWMHCHPLSSDIDRKVRSIAEETWNCNTCSNRASEYVRLSGPNGALFFEGDTFPTGYDPINKLRRYAIDICSNEPIYDIVLVTTDPFSSPQYTSPNGNNQGVFYHWTISVDLVTDPTLVNRMNLLWPKVKSSVVERLLKFLGPDARATMDIIRKVIENGSLERPEYWRSTCDWLMQILDKFPLNAHSMTPLQKESLCVFAMATGNCSGNVHFNFQTAENFLDFMVMESKEAIAAAMDARSDPRFNQISQVARAKADRGVTNKYGVALMWDGKIYKDDLDLHVVTPWGKIYYGNKILPLNKGKLDFDAGISGNEAEPVENVSLCDEIVGQSISVYIDNFTRRTYGDIQCDVVITQLGQADLIIPVVWPKDREKRDLLHVCDHTFTAANTNDPEMSEKAARAALAQAKEFDELFGVPTSMVATTIDLIDAGLPLIVLDTDNSNEDKIYTDIKNLHSNITNNSSSDNSLNALNEFNNMIKTALSTKTHNIQNSNSGNDEKEGKRFLSQRLADLPPTTVDELIDALSKTNGKTNLSIHIPDHVPGYITIVTTKSENALRTGKTTILASCHFEEKFKHPLKPVKTGTARLDSSWVNTYINKVNVTAITKIDGKVFLMLENARLPDTPDFPLGAGFYPQDLSVDGHKHRSKWAFLNTSVKPQMPSFDKNIAQVSLAIGTFLTGEKTTVFLNGKKLVLNV
jgi:hypothetical protein